MLQSHLLFRFVAFCTIAAFTFTSTAFGDRNSGSRSRSEPSQNRTIGQDVSEDISADVALSIPSVADVEIGLLGTAWLVKNIAGSFMALAQEVAKDVIHQKESAPGEILDVEPPQAIEPRSKSVPESTQAVKPETQVDSDPVPRPDRANENAALDATQALLANDVVDPEPEPAQPDNEQVAVDIPSQFELRRNQDMVDTSMPVLSELMAKLERLDVPTDEHNDGNGDQRARRDDIKTEEDHNVEMNTKDAIAFRELGDESLISPGHGVEVNYPDNPNTNMVDGEIARLTAGGGVAGIGQDHSNVFAMATLSPNSEFGQAMIMSPLSQRGLGAITTSVHSVDPANVVFLRAAPSMPNPSVSQRVRSVSRGNSKVKRVALTFDDGPHPKYTSKLLGILDYYDVNATFFYVGLQAKKYPQWIKMTNQAGHEIASQTYDHFRLPKLPLEEKQYQIDAYQNLIENTIGVTPRFLRPPGGQLDDVTKRLLDERDMVLALWDVALNDTREGKTSAEILNTAKSDIRPGSVILAHDGIDATIEVLPELIEYLQSKGYEFVTMSELAHGL